MEERAREIVLPEERRLATQSSKSLEASLQAVAVQARLNPTLGILSTLGVSAVTALGVYFVVHGQLTPGELLIALGYLRGLQSPIRQLAKLSFSIGKAAAGVERIRETLSRSPQVDERPGAAEQESWALVSGHVLRTKTLGFAIVKGKRSLLAHLQAPPYGRTGGMGVRSGEVERQHENR